MNSEILDRLPPQSLDAERHVIGSILLDPSICDEVAAKVRPSDFYSEANRLLYAHLLAMHEARSSIDVALLVTRLRSMGDFDAVGGASYIAEIAQGVPVAAHAVHYASIVRTHATRRELIHSAVEMMRDAWDPSCDPRLALDRAEASLVGIEAGDIQAEPRPVQEAVMDAMSVVEAIVERKSGSGVATGIKQFDLEVGGLFGSELIILAGRPGHGKSALAYQWAHWMATHGRRVLYSSVEMARDQLALRQVCSMAGVSLRRVRTGAIGPADLRELVAAAAKTSAATVWIQDCSRLTAFDVRRAARRMQADVVFVDYLQILKPIDDKPKRYEQLGATARALRDLAKELKIPVVALAQLNRKTDEFAKSRRPRLSDLRESGDLENDADVVLAVHRPDEGITVGSSRRDAELIVAKNRQGAHPTIALNWDGERTRFVEPEDSSLF